MFSYHRVKYGLLFAVIAIGAITTVSIASTMDNNAKNLTDDLFNIFTQGESFDPSNANDGGGGPSSIYDLQNANDGGGGPS